MRVTQHRDKVVNGGVDYWRWLERECGDKDPVEDCRANPDLLEFKEAEIDSEDRARLLAVREFATNRLERRVLFTDREDVVFEKHFIKHRSLESVASSLGITRQRASAICKQVVKKLQERFLGLDKFR